MSSPTVRRSAAVAAGLALAVTGMAAFPASTGATGNSTPMYLEHAGTAFLQLNQSADEIADEAPSSAEIIDFTANGKQLVYSDSLAGRIGFLDTSSVSDPLADGTVDLPGDPTSVAIHRQWALVSINTSDSFDDPSGELLVISLKDRSIVRTIPLGGQPDAIAISPTGKYAAIAIENERDEDENDGLIPQAPGGLLQIVDLRGNPGKWTVRDVDLTGLDGMFAASDPEPEYVDINARDLAVVSLQENNHLAIVDLKTGAVVNHFSAGSVDEVPYVDTVEEELGPQENGLISLTGTVEDRRREPDAVAWIDDDTFATANEGDYEDEAGDEGGSRSFTLFNVDGTVEYEAGNSFEHLIASIGHYPEGRSENKGNEPEGLEVGTFQDRTLLFVASERANAVGVYEIVEGTPELVQVLPTGIGPEGLKFRNGVLAVSAEVDGFDDGFAARPFVTFFEMQRTATPTYPYLVSGLDADNGSMAPIPWVAQSALAGDPADPDVLYSTSDSFLAQSYIYRIDISSHPAVITDRIPVGDADGAYDLEGIAAREEGGFWLASEGRVGDRPNAIVRVDDDGAIADTVELPAALAAVSTSSGFEGVAVTGTAAAGDEQVYVVVQREWNDDADGFVKVGRYDVADDEWTFVSYALDAVESPNGGWVGLSEITALPDGTLAIVERDNQLGLEARVKRVYGIDPADAEWRPYGSTLDVIGKTLLRDILADLDDASISVPDKVEGLGLTADGDVWLSTDNDGVDENYGETLLFSIGSLDSAFAD